jgi:hypothetical protein
MPPPFLRKEKRGKSFIGKCNRKTFVKAKKRSASNVLKCLVFNAKI